MSNFLIDIHFDPFSGSYIACYADGTSIALNAHDYHDAVLEADMIEPHEYQS